MKEKEIRLPEGWESELLINLCSPKQYKTIPTKALLESGYTVYGANGKIGFFNEYTHKDPVLMITCRGATCGNLHISEPYSYINGNAMVLDDLKNTISMEYLYFALKARKFDDVISGSAQPQITKQGLSEVEIIFPSLKEQHHISQKLTALLTSVDEAKKRLENIPILLKQFRQSVLAEAVSGKLTEAWRGSDEYQQIDKLMVPTDWVISTLGKEFNYGSCKKKTPEEILEYEWVLELEDIEKETSKLLSKEFNQSRQAKSTKNIFKKNDVLYGKLRPYLNKIIIADQDGVCTTEIIPISGNEKIHHQYLFYWLKSPYFFNYVNEITYGVNMPRLGTQDGKKALIAIPPKAEQTQIIHQVETYFALADKIEVEAKNALEKVSLLTQSILAKAFRGELSADWREQQAVGN